MAFLNVVLSGYYGFDNVGDEAILSSIIHALRSYEPAIDITVLSNDPSVTREVHGVQAVNRWKIKEIINALRKADGFISGGGSLLQDETGMRSIPYYMGIMQLAKWLGKPVYVYAQGMGPFHKKHNRWIAKKILQKIDGLSVRDEDSKKLLRSIGVNRDIQIVPDPVIGMDASKYDSDWFQNQNFIGKVGAVSVRDWPTDSGFKGKIAKVLDRCVYEQGMDIVFVPMHGEHDHKASFETAELMQEKCVIAPYDAEIEEKIAIIRDADFLLGMRLHALIFAAIGYTPFVALSYDPKIDAFADIVGQPVAGHVSKSDWTADTLYESVSAVIENLSGNQEKLKQAVLPLQERAVKTAGEALAYFK